jgi:hypothetical protein
MPQRRLEAQPDGVLHGRAMQRASHRHTQTTFELVESIIQRNGHGSRRCWSPIEAYTGASGPIPPGRRTDRGSASSVSNFGACIHTPPPPSNQILRVTAASPIQNLRTMDSVWVSGRLKAATSDFPMGRSSYSMQIDAIEPYRRKED